MVSSYLVGNSRNLHSSRLVVSKLQTAALMERGALSRQVPAPGVGWEVQTLTFPSSTRSTVDSVSDVSVDAEQECRQSHVGPKGTWRDSHGGGHTS